jgi:hypothetical protein
MRLAEHGASVEEMRSAYTRAVWKVHGLTLLLRIGSLWRCGDGLFFEVPTWRTMHFLKRSTRFSKTCYRQLITSTFFLPRSSLFMVRKAQKSHGARSGFNFMFSLEKVDRWNPIRTPAIQIRSCPMRFLGFSNRDTGTPRQNISKWSTVCSTLSRSGWSVVRSASLHKEVLRKRDRHRTSTKFRLVVIRWVHELCKRLS